LSINGKLQRLIATPKRFKIVIGGRGSGKSQGVADILQVRATQGRKIACFREYQNSIDESVYSLLIERIKSLDTQGFNVLRNEIDHVSGGKFRFRGLARNVDSVKSMHGFNDFWIEEAQAISEESLRILTPTVRSDDSEIWMTANPMSQADPFSQRFIEPWATQLYRDGIYEDDLHLIIVLNWRDNPWFPAVLEQERQHDYDNLPRALYDHVWEGRYNDSIDNGLIQAEWFDACIDAHVKLKFKPLGSIIVAHDPSDGGDAKALAMRHGSIILDARESDIADVNDGCDWATGYALENRADVFVWDSDGLGLSLRRQIGQSLDGRRITAEPFRGGDVPDDAGLRYQSELCIAKGKTNREAFKNQRAQMYIRLRDRCYATYKAVKDNAYTDPELLISFSSQITDIIKLRSELCRIPVKPTPNGLIQIMTKQEMMRVYKIKSPNLADAVMMTMITTRQRATQNIERDAWGRQQMSGANWKLL
jgi:phage terminase large subunit